MTTFRVPELSTYEYQQSILSVLASPPATPSLGDRYIIAAAGASGDWTGHESKIAWCSNATGPVWTIDTPTDGSIAWNEAISAFLTYDGAAWTGNWEVSTGIITVGGSQLIYDANADGFTDSLFVGNGGQNLDHSTGAEGWYNTGLGADALKKVTFGSWNVALGKFAMEDATTGSNNMAIGGQACANITSGDGNVGIGVSSMRNVTTTDRNIGIGGFAGQIIADSSPNTTPYSGIYIGYNCRALADGQSNEIVIGALAVGNGSNTVTIGASTNTEVYLTGDVDVSTGRVTVAGGQILYYGTPDGFSNSIFVGNGGMSLSHASGSQGYYNTGIGLGCLADVTTGSLNTAIGYQSMNDITTGTHNASVGSFTLANAIAVTRCVAFGYAALLNLETGFDNAGIGYNSGRYIADGSAPLTDAEQCLYIGTNSRASADGVVKENCIGVTAIGNGSNTTTIGASTNTDVYLSGDVRPSVGYKSSDGTSGATQDFALDGGGTLSVKDGLVVGYTPA
jgi:hypothetical protein